MYSRTQDNALLFYPANVYKFVNVGDKLSFLCLFKLMEYKQDKRKYV